MSICYPYFMVTVLIGVIGMGVPDLSVRDTEIYRRIRNNHRLKTFVISGMVVAFSAFRMISAYSIDEYAYRNRFIYYAGKDFIAIIKETTEPVFAGIVWLSTRLFHTDQGILIITGSLTVLLLLGAIKKYSSDYSFALVLLFVSGVMYSTFNGIQQYLAAALFVCFFDLTYKRQFRKFLCLVLVCTLIHNASFFLILIYPLTREKTGSINMWIYNILFLILGSILYHSIPIIAEKYGILENYVDVVSSGHHGVKLITILINIVPAILALIARHHISEDDVTTAFANISILHAMIYILARTDVYIARLAIFTAPFTVIFLSRITRYFKDATILKVLTVALYAVVCYLQLQNITYTFNLII